MMLPDDFTQTSEDRGEALAKRIARRKLDGSACDANQFRIPIKFNYTVAGIFGAAINAENPHGSKSTSARRWKKVAPRVLSYANLSILTPRFAPINGLMIISKLRLHKSL